ncbi:MAG: Ig-like domain-containing protein [Phycisphaerae bacterium]|nr:Ig-like domain-containing protein [Phycisphaerae bacterium]
MQRTSTVIGLRITLLLIATTAVAAPPTVIKTVPENGDTAIDPALRRITVEFDQDMDTGGGWSWCGGGDNYPKISRKPGWLSKREAVLYVRLEPNHEYALSVNCPSAKNFRGANGESAVPYPITFTTADGTAPGVSAEDHKEALKELRRAIDEDYSYIDVHKTDWDKQFGRYGKKLAESTSAEEFAETAGKMLAAAKDIHIWLTVGEKGFASYKRRVPPNCNRETLAKVVPGFKMQNDIIGTGRFDDGIGYILIRSWSAQDPQAFDAAFEALADMKDCKGLIVDVRMNSGGDEALAQKFAGCFIDKPAVYAKSVIRDKSTPSGFSREYERALEPTKARPEYRGKVAVLTGRYVMSSCEGFLLMMKQVPGCKLVGEASYGASGNPRPVVLPNNVTVFLPSWKSMTPDGKEIECVGIEPDIPVKTDEKDSQQRDPVLDAALAELRS